jgi:hypothetical protein
MTVVLDLPVSDLWDSIAELAAELDVPATTVQAALSAGAETVEDVVQFSLRV